MELLRTKPEEYKEVLELIRQAQKALKRLGVDQWQNGYPNLESVKQDIEDNISYVVKEEGEILGTAAIILTGEPDYDIIYEGEWLTNLPYITVHRVAVKEDCKRKGIASFLLQQAQQIALAHNLFSIRLDTHRDNLVMQNCLTRNGLKRCGIIYLKDGSERFGYEKKLE